MAEIQTSSVNQLLTATEGGREVLLVGLKPEHRDKPQYQRALRREYAQLHETEHPNIVKYLDLRDDEAHGPCIAMEWEPARTLADYIAEGHTTEEKKAIVRQIADALSCLHRSRIVHGALNTRNIFVTTQADRVKVLCFRETYADALSEPAATMKFRAPEAKDGTVGLDARTDIYSLGLIVKDMDLGPDFASVVSTAGSFTRTNRYMDVDAFLEAFEHRRYTRREPDGSSSGNHSRRMAIIIAIVVAIATVAALAFFNGRSTSGESVEAAQTEQTEQTNQTSQTGQTSPSSQPAAPTAAPSPEPSPATAAPAPTAYTGELAFLAELVPQMQKDLDKIYASTPDRAAVKAKVSRYYKGLRKALGRKTEAQFVAYDKAFAEYVQKKNAEE